MMHFHFNEQVVADHQIALHDQAYAYRLLERGPARERWYRRLTRRLRPQRGVRSLQPQPTVAPSTVPAAQP
jgi:hypothetical protein